MRKQVFFVAVMAVLLVAGMLSSAACEVTCAPPSAAGVCCPHPAPMQRMQPAEAHCAHAGKVGASRMTCAHPDDSGVTVASLAAQDNYPALLHVSITDAVQSSMAGAGAHGSPPAVAFPRRPSLIPLRI